eukprot:COSAG01_NODE_36301_length_519_cov_2.085714_1_plen_54_part_10
MHRVDSLTKQANLSQQQLCNNRVASSAGTGGGATQKESKIGCAVGAQTVQQRGL